MKRQYSFCLLLVVMVLYTGYFSYNHVLIPAWEEASIRRLVDGTATTPMQYRVFIPWLVKMLEPLIPHIPFISHINGLRYFFELASTFLLLISFYAFVHFLLLSYCNSLSTVTRTITASAALFLLMLVLPFHFLAPRMHGLFYYPSDISSVMFFVLGMWTIHSRKWFAYYPLFVLATFNRETTCFLTIYFLLLYHREVPVSSMIRHVAVQAALWILIKIFLYYLYEANINPNYADAVFFKMTLNQNFTQHWVKTIVFLPSVYGFLWLPLLLYVSHISPVGFRRAMLVIPIFHVLMLIPGEVYELRIYAEMIPVVIAGLVVGVCNCLSNQALHHYAPQAARG